MALLSDQAFPKIIVTEGSAPTSPSAGTQKLYIDSADHKLKRKDSGGTVTLIESTASFITGSGTSFPGSPSTNDVYYRTDRGLLYYYDGTRWLTVNEYALTFTPLDALQPVTVSGNAMGYVPTDAGANGMWLTRYAGATLVGTTNNGSNYWTVQLKSMSPTITLTNVGSTYNTSAAAVDNYVARTLTIGAALTTGDIQVRAVATKTGTPGGIFHVGALYYRLIG